MERLKEIFIKIWDVIYAVSWTGLLMIRYGFNLDRTFAAQNKIIDNLNARKVAIERMKYCQGMYAISHEFLRDNCLWYENHCKHPEGDGYCAVDTDCPLCKKLVKL